MIKAIGYAAKTQFSKLKPYKINRRSPNPDDITIEVMHCGVCHSDVHQVKNEWKNTVYPCMPGHEVIGKVIHVGKKVSKHKIGDIVGVGCLVDSCLECENCVAGLENCCLKGATGTYNGNMRTPSKDNLTYGGYSDIMVVKEHFVLKIPKSLDLAKAAPLLCAGITTYSPLKQWQVGPGTKVGIVGLGGLGHLAVKIAVAMEAEVTVVTSSEEKKRAAHNLGAKKVIISDNESEMKKGEKSLDFILSTIPQSHDANVFAELLKTDGIMVIVGCLVPLKKPLDMSKLLMDRKTITTSVIGGIKETQECLIFCAKHGIEADIEVIDIDELNTVYKSVDKGDIPYRYVIDMNSLKEDQVAEPQTFVEQVVALVR